MILIVGKWNMQHMYALLLLLSSACLNITLQIIFFLQRVSNFLLYTKWQTLHSFKKLRSESHPVFLGSESRVCEIHIVTRQKNWSRIASGISPFLDAIGSSLGRWLKKKKLISTGFWLQAICFRSLVLQSYIHYVLSWFLPSFSSSRAIFFIRQYV